MGRNGKYYTKACRKELKYWQSLNSDCKEKCFAMIGSSFLESEEWAKLSPMARLIYICMLVESKGVPIFHFTHGTAYRKYHISKSSYDRNIEVLLKAGLLRRVLPDDPEKRGRFDKNEFQFSKDFKLQVMSNNIQKRKAKELEKEAKRQEMQKIEQEEQAKLAEALNAAV